jgi:hypothetical protein
MTGRLLILAALCSAATVLGLAGSAVSDPRPAAHAAGQDSPWPRTKALRPNVRALQREVDDLATQVELMEISANRYDDWETCLTYVPVSEYGDPDRQFGYVYDDRDGTGGGYMDGLAVDRRSRPGREDYMFIDFARRGCRSDAPLPGGTADPASLRPRPSSPAGLRPLASTVRSSGRAALRSQVKSLERRARRLSRRAQRLETASERFDEWESCVSWVPVTELGDPEGKFGYLYGPRGTAPGYRPALHIDRSDWDDPDYMFLALVGGDRPGRTCQDEPGEAVD